VPKFDADASLSMWAIEVVIGDQVARVPPLPASAWLPVLMTGDAKNSLDLVEGEFDLASALLHGGATVEDVVEQLTVLVEAVAGRALVTALTIAEFARDRWDLVGPDMARIGMRFDQVPLGYALDAIWSTLMRVLDEKALKSFVDQVDRAERGEDERVGVEPPPSLRDAPPLPASAEQYVQTRPRTRPLWRRPPPVVLTERPKTLQRPRVGSGQPGGNVPLASREQARRHAELRASDTSSPPRPISRLRRASSGDGSGESTTLSP
jgi:hypothetical protein